MQPRLPLYSNTPWPLRNQPSTVRMNSAARHRLRRRADPRRGLAGSIASTGRISVVARSEGLRPIIARRRSRPVLCTGKLTWTPEQEAIFGVEPRTVNCYADFRDLVHPDDIEKVEAARDTAVRRSNAASWPMSHYRTPVRSSVRACCRTLV